MKMKAQQSIIQVTVKAVQRGKVLAMRTYTLKKKIRDISNKIMMHHEVLEKEEQSNHKIRRKEIIKMAVQINEMETERVTQASMKERVISLKEQTRLKNSETTNQKKDPY
jgi:hypothetical protein